MYSWHIDRSLTFRESFGRTDVSIAPLLRASLLRRAVGLLAMSPLGSSPAMIRSVQRRLFRGNEIPSIMAVWLSGLEECADNGPTSKCLEVPEVRFLVHYLNITLLWVPNNQLCVPASTIAWIFAWSDCGTVFGNRAFFVLAKDLSTQMEKFRVELSTDLQAMPLAVMHGGRKAQVEPLQVVKSQRQGAANCSAYDVAPQATKLRHCNTLAHYAFSYAPQSGKPSRGRLCYAYKTPYVLLNSIDRKQHNWNTPRGCEH
ncbi:hypothetical protein DFH11DRAFT_1543044 [Phellopilus nigrolimitatus]|nr:hypothetical protein DFH11DRAFT_1543044 [Phellopilus nigrolimitatus]